MHNKIDWEILQVDFLLKCKIIKKNQFNKKPKK